MAETCAVTVDCTDFQGSAAKILSAAAFSICLVQSKRQNKREKEEEREREIRGEGCV